MTKKRTSAPRATADAVLKEFRNRCAICGRYEPQLHHIDQNPSNNAAENLIPLCPNCHLQDIHDPTSIIDSRKIQLFRRLKDPFILDSRFHPLWQRICRIADYESDDVAGYSYQFLTSDLLKFISSLTMGQYYAYRLKSALRDPVEHMIAEVRAKGETVEDAHEFWMNLVDPEIREFVNRQIEDICVEMLRYQDWPPKERAV